MQLTSVVLRSALLLATSSGLVLLEIQRSPGLAARFQPIAALLQVPVASAWGDQHRAREQIAAALAAGELREADILLRLLQAELPDDPAWVVLGTRLRQAQASETLRRLLDDATPALARGNAPVSTRGSSSAPSWRDLAGRRLASQLQDASDPYWSQLLQLIASEPNLAHRQLLVEWLGQYGDPRAARMLVNQARIGATRSLRLSALAALSRLGLRRSLPEIALGVEALCLDTDEELGQAAIDAVVLLNGPRAATALARLRVACTATEQRRLAANALAWRAARFASATRRLASDHPEQALALIRPVRWHAPAEVPLLEVRSLAALRREEEAIALLASYETSSADDALVWLLGRLGTQLRDQVRDRYFTSTAGRQRWAQLMLRVAPEGRSQ
jgi:hypothetical protein